jgi:4,5-DOPA dioxygenase extradiol
LRDAFARMRGNSRDTPDWARAFDDEVEQRLGERDTNGLLETWPTGARGRLAHPTPDHWLPLIYAYAASDAGDRVAFPTTGFDLGSISMRNVVFG